jgi:eukaryotic-like serine/threonine-protein kinase
MTDTIDRLAAALADRYRLERELGAGGMATVYLAEDPKHHRKVALKVLRPELAAVIGAERFLAEIRTTANLQHPHILPLYDSGRATIPPLSDAERGSGGEVLFYVMPYIEGESLRDRLNREKQLPVEDAVRIAREVAAALDYAHRRGIVHRDIKPENILLHDGQALVADFGIALALSTAGGSRMTETGMSLGTPHYMSPEQAMGEREITARSDVYALGAVLYEMLLGEPPFTGPTAQAIVAKVMTEKPAPITARRDRVGAAVEDAVLTALEKLPADRFATAAEFAQALTREQPARERQAAPPRLRPRLRAVVAVAAGVVALGAGYFAGRAAGRRAVPETPPSRLAILAPSVGGSGAPALHRQLTLTPDGGTVVYVAVLPTGQNQLMRQRLEDAEPSPIAGAIGVAGPQVTPDGQWIVAFAPATSSAVRLPLTGGTPVALPAGVRSTWGGFDRAGTFWFWPGDARAGTGELTADGRLEFRFEASGSGNRIQQILPDGRTALAVRSPVGTNSGPGVLLDLRTGRDTVLVDAVIVEMHYTAGYLLVVRPDGALDAAPFDARRNRLAGRFVPIATGVAVTGTGVAHLAVSSNGTVAYLPEEPRSLALVDRTGGARLATEARHNFHAPAFAPDGRRISVDLTAAGGRDVWILALDQGTLTRATFDRDGHDARWAPDGRSIVYTTARTGTFGIFRTRPGSGVPPDSLLADPRLTFSGTWLPDGSALVATGTNMLPGSGPDVVLVRDSGRGPVEPIVSTPFVEQYPIASPDGRWLAFVSDQSGRQEVYVRALAGDGDMVQVSREGGTEPVWGPDGRELFYLSTEGQVNMMAAGIRTSPTLEVTARTVLFDAAEYVGTNPHANYDISPDGRTFVLVRRSPATRVVILQNLPELVRRLSRGEAGGR